MNRRDFIKGAAVTLAATSSPALSRSAYAGGADTLKVGLIGCGGRGTGAALQALAADRGTVIWAMADVFMDRLQSSLNGLEKNGGEGRVNVPAERQFDGFEGYKKVVEECDVVLLATTPAFRPLHLRYAVDNGCQVFCEKPVAVDGPGLRSVLESARIAQEKGLCLAHGFCWRAHLGKRAVYGEINSGRIGEVRLAYGTYLAGGVWHRGDKPEWTEMERHLRNWYYHTYLGGDHIVEQAVHSIDKILWAFGDQAPKNAIAVGGRQQRTDKKYGDIWDHFSVIYEFEGGAQGHLMTRQWDGTSMENLDRVLGSDGIAHIDGWADKFRVEGKRPWNYEGPGNNMYQTEHDELFAAIREGRQLNQGAAMVRSTQAAILGRMAAYTGKRVSWDECLNSEEQLTPNTWEWGDRPNPAPPIPGKA
ncbi:MAG TPA: Gfo/Idh/MocA family oxidoreductase [Planctomycetota bacterium]|nr:oxidoreductase [Planctomycetota bacterium]HJM39767.1 Gfo/Idh/MocA family oxidoreductase [Planctomycetota bacterium]